jgi:hypothetical protein
MDGHPRQNPAYRPATEKALVTGLFLCLRFAGDSSGSHRGGRDCGLRGTARCGRPAWPLRLCRLRVAPRVDSTRKTARGVATIVASDTPQSRGISGGAGSVRADDRLDVSAKLLGRADLVQQPSREAVCCLAGHCEKQVLGAYYAMIPRIVQCYGRSMPRRGASRPGVAYCGDRRAGEGLRTG